MGPHEFLLDVVRMEACPEFGLRREAVTCTQYELDAFYYSLARLGEILNKGSYVEKTVIVPDMNGTYFHEPFPGEEPGRFCVRLRALLPKRGANDFIEIAEIADGFTYSPYGPGASSFGFYSVTTIAWVVPHRDNPVFMFKATSDENISAVTKFIEAIMGIDEVPPWPVQPTEKVLVVPSEMSKLSPRPGMARRNRAKARATRLRSR